jgi:hypothetical protein
MGFDADAFARAHLPWTVTLRAETFTAVDPSADEVIRFRAEMLAASEDLVAQRAVLRRFLRRRFPWRVGYLWRGDPVGRFLALPLASQEAALLTLFHHLEARRPARLQSQGRGSSSGNRTATSSPAEAVAP